MTVDSSGQMKVQVFCVNSGKNIVSPYSSSKDEVVKLAADVIITIDGISVPYLAGDVIGLYKGRTYTLSVATDIHVM